jgi:glyoxylase-like metal-dependent hydrolase (beta-lactamase superfamily II)
VSRPRYDVQCVRYATLQSSKAALYHRYEAYGEPDADLEMAYFFWLLRRGPETIVVDCGFAPEAGSRRGRTCLHAPIDALGALGVDPASVSTVLVTHLHYDHIGNLPAFPAATFVVPRRELEFWTSPAAATDPFASIVEPREIAFVADAAAAGRVRLIDGSEEIADGVRSVTVGGHSPGQQVVVVRGSGGAVVLASDAAHFREELELRRPFAVLHDLERMHAAYDLLDQLAAAGAVVVPGHDPAVESAL